MEDSASAFCMPDKPLSGRNNGIGATWGRWLRGFETLNYTLTFDITEVEQKIQITEEIIVKQSNLIPGQIITDKYS